MVNNFAALTASWIAHLSTLKSSSSVLTTSNRQHLNLYIFTSKISVDSGNN